MNFIRSVEKRNPQGCGFDASLLRQRRGAGMSTTHSTSSPKLERLTPTDVLLERVHLIPDELVERDQWLVWRLTKRGKTPFQAANPLVLAEADNPATWSSFQVAIDCFADHLDKPDRFLGIGYVFSAEDPYVGIDLDDCVQGDVIHPEARRIIQKIDGYAEISPSMTGVKIWTRAILPQVGNKTGKQKDNMPWGGKLEIYRERRWFAVTGWRVEL